MALSHPSRRTVLRSAAQAPVAWTALSYSRILGTNDRFNLGLIGAGERGRWVMDLFQQTGRVQVTAVCDVCAEMIDKAKSKAPEAKACTDHRKLLEQKDIDIS